MVDGTSAALVYKVFSFQFSVFSRALSRPVQSPHVPRSVRSRGKALCFSPNPFPASARKAGLFADTPLNSHGLQNSKKLHSPPFEAAHPGFAGAAGTFWKPCAPHIPMLAPDGAPRFSAVRIVVLFNFIGRRIVAAGAELAAAMPGCAPGRLFDRQKAGLARPLRARGRPARNERV